MVDDLAAEANLFLKVSYIPGADLPELAQAIKEQETWADAHSVVSMSNYAVASITDIGVSQQMLEACQNLS